jgi:hypothetical protein
MKSDATTTALNFVLGVLVILGLVFASLSILRTRELRRMTSNAAIANSMLLRAQGLANDVAVYNVSAKSPELTRILQSVQSHNATTNK